MSLDALAATRRRSEMTLAEMQRLLESCSDIPAILTIAVSGSLGRLEQTARSDADVIVVLCDSGENPSKIVQSVWQLLEPLGLRLPKSGGIFSVAATRQQLCGTDSLGIIDEDMPIFGQRMQLLLDSRAVLGVEAFRGLQRGILERFAARSCEPEIAAADLWRPLLDDLLRYHRSLCVRYQHAEHQNLPGWPELQLKAKYSRLVNVVGLIFLLAESTAHHNPLTWLADHLALSPLGRIAHCYRRYNDKSLDRITRPYAEFLVALEENVYQVDLHSAAEAMKSKLIGFLLTRVEHGDWLQRFLEHLLL